MKRSGIWPDVDNPTPPKDYATVCAWPACQCRVSFLCDYAKGEIRRHKRNALFRVAFWLGAAAVFGFIVGWSLP